MEDIRVRPPLSESLRALLADVEAEETKQDALEKRRRLDVPMPEQEENIRSEYVLSSVYWRHEKEEEEEKETNAALAYNMTVAQMLEIVVAPMAMVEALIDRDYHERWGRPEKMKGMKLQLLFLDFLKIKLKQ